MRQRGARLGRLFGIDVRVDFSWLLVFALVAWGMSAAFATGPRALGTAASVVWALLAAAGFFASVVAHELAHALVGRAHGVGVRDITLFLLGGVANFDEDPRSPRAEFQCAAAGPLASAALGALCLLLGGGSLSHPLAHVGAPDVSAGAASAVLRWLGSVNLVVAAFNLFPGYPLDGGRVLRAGLWALTGDADRATRAAARAGQAWAVALLAAGAAMALGARVPVFGAGAAGGLWLIAVGVFLLRAARGSVERAELSSRLRGLPVWRVMGAPAGAVPADLPALWLRNWFTDAGAGARGAWLAVIEGDRVVGAVSSLDAGRARAGETAGGVMQPPGVLVSVSPDCEAAEALQRLLCAGSYALPVVCGGRLVGSLSLEDLLRAASWAPARGRTAGAGAGVELGGAALARVSSVEV